MNNTQNARTLIRKAIAAQLQPLEEIGCRVLDSPSARRVDVVASCEVIYAGQQPSGNNTQSRNTALRDLNFTINFTIARNNPIEAEIFLERAEQLLRNFIPIENSVLRFVSENYRETVTKEETVWWYDQTYRVQHLKDFRAV